MVRRQRAKQRVWEQGRAAPYPAMGGQRGAKRKREEGQYDCVALPSVMEPMCLVPMDGHRFVVNDLIDEPLDEVIPIVAATL